MKKIKRLETIEEAKAFASFLAAERNRHLEDIKNAEQDLLLLQSKWGIEIPWDNTYFVIAGD
uniref:Uncharacterized protein n=1 Tax=viral metagenome TaxID=1070528 RepID=A0A6H1ZUI6_9ZZZZ